MANIYTTLGSTRVAAIASAQPGIFDDFLTVKMGVTIPSSKIKSMRGTLPHEVVQNVLPLATTASDVRVGVGVNAFTRAPIFGERNYAADRSAIKLPYDQNLSFEELVDDVERSLIPNATRALTFGLDSLLFEIMSGAGAALNSRDITSVPAATAWKTGAVFGGSPITDLLDARNKTAADIVYLSEDVYQLLAQHPQVNDANTGSNGGTAYMSREHLAAKIGGLLGVSEVVIGGRIYQNGLESAAVNLALAGQGIAYVGRKANIAYVPFGSPKPQYKEWIDDDKDEVYLQASIYADVVSVDPALSRTITGLTA